MSTLPPEWNFSDTVVRDTLKSVDTGPLAAALAEADESVVALFQTNMSERAWKIIEEMIEKGQPWSSDQRREGRTTVLTMLHRIHDLHERGES